MKTTIHVKMDMRDPDLLRIREIARGSRVGKVVAFPTETVYGIGLPMSVKGAQNQLAELKRRSSEKPFSFHIGEWDMIDFLAVKRTPAFRYLVRKFWPGPLTLIVHNQQGNKIGLRFPRHYLTSTLINATGEPFLATSANRSGGPSPHTAQQVMEQFGNEVDYLIDGGTTELKKDSSIVDLTSEEPEIIRQAAAGDEVAEAVEKIKAGKFPRKRILVVCTGNSCRSPMAQGWIEAELKQKGLADEIEISSCGVSTRDGMPPTAEAIYVMKNREVDISNHRSHLCSREDIVAADIIIAMGKEHYTFIVGMVPAARNRTKVFHVRDPIGAGMDVYEEVMSLIEKQLEANWNWIVS